MSRGGEERTAAGVAQDLTVGRDETTTASVSVFIASTAAWGYLRRWDGNRHASKAHSCPVGRPFYWHYSSGCSGASGSGCGGFCSGTAGDKPERDYCVSVGAGEAPTWYEQFSATLVRAAATGDAWSRGGGGPLAAAPSQSQRCRWCWWQ